VSNEVRKYNNAFISLIDERPGKGSVAVKDIIDVQGTITTAGCKAIAESASVAQKDADCLRTIRQHGYRIFGKTNLHELAFGTTGINTWTHTPVNPQGEEFIPGGSSSGNAVAIALDVCEFGIGTDTGGSVRIPSACCGIAGLKPTYGRISTKGIRALAPTLDVVGPMAKDISTVSKAFGLLDPSFEGHHAPLTSGCRLLFDAVDPYVEDEITRALGLSEIAVRPCPLTQSDWEDAIAALNDILWAEAALSNVSIRCDWPKLQNASNLHRAADIARDQERVSKAFAVQSVWKQKMNEIVNEFGIIVTPTLETRTPTFTEVHETRIRLARFTSPVNLSGLPAIVVPLPKLNVPASSLQIIGQSHREDVLIATALRIEEALMCN